MPLYEYKCERCGHVMEKLQSRSDSPAPDTCPGCQAVGTLQRLVSSTSFQLKGSGWYVTDYAGKGASSGGSASSDSGSSETAASSEASAPAAAPTPSGGGEAA